MKRILATVTVVALCMALVGCGGIFLSKNDKEKFYVTDPSLHVLEDMDEFGVYEDGKAILTAEEMEMEEDLILVIPTPNILEEAIQENRMTSAEEILRRSGGSALGARWRK